MVHSPYARHIPAGRSTRPEREDYTMKDIIKWKIIELLIRYRVLAPCYAQNRRNSYRR